MLFSHGFTDELRTDALCPQHDLLTLYDADLALKMNTNACLSCIRIRLFVAKANICYFQNPR